MAVGVSCGIVVALKKLVERGPPIFARMGMLVPYTAVVAAGSANLMLTRMPEMQSGAPISAPNGDPLGISSRAAVVSVQQTIASRIVCLPVRSPAPSNLIAL